MKRMLAVLAAVCIVVCLCASCGGGDEEKELPTVTPPPAGETESAAIGAENNTAPTVGQSVETYVSAEHETAAGLVGHDVSELYDAIGEPERSEYVVGCYENGDDGYLYYDGFTVITYRYTNGTETITGAYAE